MMAPAAMSAQTVATRTVPRRVASTLRQSLRAYLFPVSSTVSTPCLALPCKDNDALPECIGGTFLPAAFVVVYGADVLDEVPDDFTFFGAVVHGRFAFGWIAVPARDIERGEVLDRGF